MYMYCLDFNNKKDYDDHNKYLYACALINVANVDGRYEN